MPSRAISVITFVMIGATSAGAQTVDDGGSFPRGILSAGVVYTHDSWDHYWEGTRKRTNGNIGTLTQQSVALIAGYGVTDRLSVMASLPYVHSHASQGVLHDISGIQDLTFAAKLKVFATRSSRRGALNAFIVGTGAVPVSDYTPDFFPLSIGTGGGRASGRVTLGYQSASSWFLNASSAYTWCSNVTLNRNSYYTDGQLYLTNEVAMPNVIEHSLTAGLNRGRWHVPLSLMKQRTLGGGDIRRQDMPFVSNRMDYVRASGGFMYALRKDVSISIGAAHVLSGRNVGQSTTFTSGLFFAHHF